MAEWQNGRMAEWQNGRRAEWQNGRTAERQNGRMAGGPPTFRRTQSRPLCPPLLPSPPAIYANDFGCSLASLGLLESASECRQWVHGDSYFILDRPLAQVVEGMAKGTQVRLLPRYRHPSDMGGGWWVVFCWNADVAC